ncbi:MAG: hypothetical protein HN531_00685 [Opitutae bacterium]|jgi:hypothetical protein|nr:hypothetical protein [Opitutae bacterium]
MELFGFSILTSFLLFAVGFLFASGRSSIHSFIRGFPRSLKLAVFLLALALSWFIARHVMNLSEADFGEYRWYIGGIAIFIGVSSYVFVRDFLAVRAFCILALFYSREVLDAAFLQEPTTRLFLVSIIYLIIVGALYFGAWPYRMRDFLDWLFDKPARPARFGWGILGCAVVLLGLSFTY